MSNGSPDGNGSEIERAFVRTLGLVLATFLAAVVVLALLWGIAELHAR